MDQRSKLTTGRLVREACRQAEVTGQTSALAAGFAQANLVVLSQHGATDFLEFCRRNPKPCPLLDVTRPGHPTPERIAPGSDLRTDLPRYRVWKNGALVE